MRARTLALTFAATALLTAGCGSSPADDLQDWYASGGEKQIRRMADDAGRVNKLSMTTLGVLGPACQELAKDLPAAQALDPIPDKSAQRSWSAALGALDKGAADCVAGTAAGDESRAFRGVRAIQLDGLGSLAEVPALIRAGLAEK